MSWTVRITPAGRLAADTTVESSASFDAALADQLHAALKRSSADGLLWLASQSFDANLPPNLGFWRDFGHRLLHALCHLSDDENTLRKWGGIDPPINGDLHAIAATAPSMRGLEYLTADVLGRLWVELRDLISEQAQQHAGGPQGLLADLNPLWRLVGRVTFHLAENKRDADRPFAFLATYAHRVSAGARLQHVPLGQALKEYAGERNQTRLAALLEPVRRAADTVALVRNMLDDRSLFQAHAWTVGQAHQFLIAVPKIEAAGVVVRAPDWWTARRPPRPHVRIRIGQKEASQLGMDSLLDFSADLALDGVPLTDAERRQLMESSDGLVLLRGHWVELDHRRLNEALDHWRQLESLHADGISFVEGMRLLAGVQLDAAEQDDPAADWSQVVAGEWLSEALQSLRNPLGAAALQPGVDLRATLRPYQADGVRWLWFITRLGLGACLADDMGLGKTIQVIDLLLQMKREDHVQGPRVQTKTRRNPHNGASASLLVVPASLVGNWKQELERFAPTLRVLYFHPSECGADELAEVAKTPAKSLAGFDVVITTYGIVRRTEWLRKLSWRLVALDEAQAIKNAASTQAKSVKQLAAAHRIVLTGTPIENHLGDLWSLFDFCNPGLLGSAAQFKQFVKRLNRGQDGAAFGALRRLVQPYILRRLKTDPDIVPDLPAKTEMRVECGLSKKQIVVYERTVADLAQRLKEAEGIARRGLVLSTLMQLKQICNHPAQYLHTGAFTAKDSGKFERLAALCEPIVERQEKLLVFTQFQSLCEPLAEHLAGVFGRAGLVLSGATAIRKRTDLVRQFQDDAGPPFFVISVKAGGSGLNLTAACHVVHFDRWWNPAVENQATDRAFRIGQKRNIMVHKFVCRGTVEERIDQMIRDKQQLADQILAADGGAQLTEMSDKELLAFVALDLNRASTDV